MIGIDEVGRGSWAGPLLVVAARSITTLPVVADSKTLSKIRRQQLMKQLSESCEFGEGWVEPIEIDELGLTDAMKLAVKRALSQLKVHHEERIIMDGNINYCPVEFTNAECVIDADATQPIVSAASIYAKVTRDNKMAELSRQFPGYGFESHVGYGTKAHKEALESLGVCILHRRSYKPIKAYL